MRLRKCSGRGSVSDVQRFERVIAEIESHPVPGVFDRDSSGAFRFDVLDWCFYMYVRENWRSYGAAQMWAMLNRDGRGRCLLRKLAGIVANAGGPERLKSRGDGGGDFAREACPATGLNPRA